MARGLKVLRTSSSVPRIGKAPSLIARWIKTGADVNARSASYRQTHLLMKAASPELAGAQTLQLLLESGANANAERTEGEKALDWAISRGDLAKKAVLEKFGATRGDGPRQQTVATAAGGVGHPETVVSTKCVAASQVGATHVRATPMLYVPSQLDASRSGSARPP